MKITHWRLLLFAGFLPLFTLQLPAQHIKMGGRIFTSTQIDSLISPPSSPKSSLQKDFLAKLTRKKGRVSLNIQLDLLRLSHLKPVQTDTFNQEYPQTLLRKRSQFQLRLGLNFYFRKSKKKKVIEK